MAVTRINKFHTPEELKAIFDEADPMHITLLNSSGVTEIPYNKYGKELAAKKIVEIVAHLKKSTTMPGIYYMVTKNRFHKDAPVYEYPTQVGTLSEPVTSPPVMQSKSEPTYTTREHIDNMLAANRWELLYEFEKKTNNLLQKKVDDLEKELRQLWETSSGSSYIKDLEVFKPLAETFFDQRDRELKIKERQVNLSEGKSVSARLDGGIEIANSQEYLDYFDRIVKSSNEDALNYECDLLEVQNPELYKKLCDHYKITE